MRPFDRGLLIIYSLALTLSFLIAIPVLAGLVNQNELSVYYSRFLQQPVLSFVLLGLLIIIGGRLFWVSVRPTREQAVVHEGALGRIRIALTAIESLVEKVVSQNSGVREVKASVFTHPQGIGIRIRAAVTPDICIPEISGVIQEQVKERVLAVTGIAVQQVDILVHSISAHKQRVE